MIHALAEVVRNIKIVTAKYKRILNLIKINIAKYKIIGFLFIIILISGCGFWSNFKTYFNTYYNAQKLFEESEQKVLEQKKELFAYEREKLPNNLNKKFEDVVKKTSSILQYNKESDYVGDALLMTGKSFYYQQNYSRALRKFNELAGIKDSELQLENKLWIGKTYLQLREFNKAIDILDEVINAADSLQNQEILEDAYKEKISYLIYDEQYPEALEEINKLLLTDLTDELKAAILYETGLLYKLTENYAKAEEMFNEVLEYSPTFETEFNSRYQLAKMEKLQGNTQKSLELFQDMKAQDKFSDSWDMIDLEIGQIYYDNEDIEKALDKFTEVDTTYSKTEASGIAGFYRAEILENYYHDYDSAMGFYTKTISSSAPKELKDKAKKKSGLLNKYIAFHDKLADLNKQLLYLSDESVFISDSLDYVEKVKQDSIKAANEPNNNNNRGDTRNRRISQRKQKVNYKKPVRPKLSADSLHSLTSNYYFRLANLLFAEFDDADSAFYYYSKSLEEKEENPNQAQILYAIGNYYLTRENKQKADSMFTIVYEKFEFDPIRNEAAKQLGKPLYDFEKDPVEDLYIKAEELYENSKYNQALTQLKKIYEDNPKSIYASKSLYTMGYILENELNMPDSAAAVYEILNKKYRSSIYAKSVLVKLTGYRQEQRRIKAVQDSIKKANEVMIDTVNINSAAAKIDSSIKNTVIKKDSIKAPAPKKIKTPRK